MQFSDTNQRPTVARCLRWARKFNKLCFNLRGQWQSVDSNERKCNEKRKEAVIVKIEQVHF